MSAPPLPVDFTALTTFDVVDVRDPREMGTTSRVSQRLHGDSTLFSYRLQDRGLLRASFDQPITIMAERRLGSMLIDLCSSQFATQIDIEGDGVNGFCFLMILQGKARLTRSKNEAIIAGNSGAALDGSPGAKILTSDVNARQSLWIEAGALEHALEGMLGDSLRKRLEFAPGVDWSGGLAASLKSQIDFLIREATRPDGIADNPVALASMTDLMLSLVLRAVPHNYLERLDHRRTGAVPAYVRRAEDFMRANAGAPIRMDHVADAAGCSVRTLGAVFRHFRDTTPLAALHAIRLDHVHVELSLGPASGSIAEVARRYGFTNPSRFITAYHCRFGEAPLETARHGLR
jgi:AraC-like DNA-binding protein